MISLAVTVCFTFSLSPVAHTSSSRSVQDRKDATAPAQQPYPPSTSGYTIAVAYTVKGGGSGFAPPTFSYVVNGANQNIVLSLDQQFVNPDVGSTWSVKGVLNGSSSAERWATNQATTGIVGVTPFLDFVYYHQFPLTISYSILGGSSPAYPSMHATSLGVRTVFYLLTEPKIIWLDKNSKFDIPGLLPGSALTERWIAVSGLSGNITSPATDQVLYYHQYLVTTSYSVHGQPASASPTLTYSSLGKLLKSSISTVPVGVWVDNGTAGRIQRVLAGSNSGDRWATDVGFPATFSGPVNLTLTYYEQMSVRIVNSTSGGNPHPPTLTGVAFAKALSENITEASPPVWLDAGSHWSLSTVSGTEASGERWTALGSPVGNITSPLVIGLQYHHQYFVTILPSRGAEISTKSGWYDAGSRVELSATPQPGLSFLGWRGSEHGSYSGNATAAQILIVGPIQEEAVFGAMIEIGSSGAGSVSYIYGSLQKSVTSSQFLLPLGTNVTLIPKSSSPFFAFGSWSGSASGAGERITLTVGGPTKVTANFIPNYFFIGGISALPVVVVTAFVLLRRSKREANQVTGH